MKEKITIEVTKKQKSDLIKKAHALNLTLREFLRIQIKKLNLKL